MSERGRRLEGSSPDERRIIIIKDAKQVYRHVAGAGPGSIIGAGIDLISGTFPLWTAAGSVAGGAVANVLTRNNQEVQTWLNEP